MFLQESPCPMRLVLQLQNIVWEVCWHARVKAPDLNVAGACHRQRSDDVSSLQATARSIVLRSGCILILAVSGLALNGWLVLCSKHGSRACNIELGAISLPARTMICSPSVSKMWWIALMWLYSFRSKTVGMGRPFRVGAPCPRVHKFRMILS